MHLKMGIKGVGTCLLPSFLHLPADLVNAEIRACGTITRFSVLLGIFSSLALFPPSGDDEKLGKCVTTSSNVLMLL